MKTKRNTKRTHFMRGVRCKDAYECLERGIQILMDLQRRYALQEREQEPASGAVQVWFEGPQTFYDASAAREVEKGLEIAELTQKIYLAIKRAQKKYHVKDHMLNHPEDRMKYFEMIHYTLCEYLINQYIPGQAPWEKK